MRGVHGVMLWSSIAISLAGRKYHQIMDRRSVAIANQVIVETNESANELANKL
jgi:hypothetical protein